MRAGRLAIRYPRAFQYSSNSLMDAAAYHSQDPTLSDARNDRPAHYPGVSRELPPSLMNYFEPVGFPHLT